MIRLLAVAVAVAVAACAHAPSAGLTGGAAAADTRLYITTNVKDADLVIDGHYMGRLRNKGGIDGLEPGRHQLELRRDDYFSAYQEVELAAGEKKSIVLDLAPILP